MNLSAGQREVGCTCQVDMVLVNLLVKIEGIQINQRWVVLIASFHKEEEANQWYKKVMEDEQMNIT